MGHGIHDHLGADIAQRSVDRVSAASQHALEGTGKKDMTWVKAEAPRITKNWPYRIATITLPKWDNGGNSLHKAHDTLTSMLLDTFGGYTTTYGKGAWKDPSDGVIYYDDNIVYHVAMEDHGTNMIWLEDTARLIGAMAHQEAIAITYPNGAFRIINTCDNG